MNQFLDLNSSGWIDEKELYLLAEHFSERNKRILVAETEIGLILVLKLGYCFQRNQDHEKWRYVSVFTIDPFKLIVGEKNAIVPYHICLPFPFFTETSLSHSRLDVKIINNKMGEIPLLTVSFEQKRVDVKGMILFPKKASSFSQLFFHGFSLGVKSLVLSAQIENGSLSL